MLRFLNQCSQGRGAWLLMAFTALALELTALWFQHVMLLKPCVLCIYERCALFGVLGAALIGAIAPKTPLRYVAMVIWLYSAFRGVQLTYEHTMLQLYPSPFATCDFMARFPEWLPLDGFQHQGCPDQCYIYWQYAFPERICDGSNPQEAEEEPGRTSKILR